MAQATAVVMVVTVVVMAAAMRVSTAAMIARRHAATTTRLLVLHVNSTMRRVQHLLIALIAATVAPHLHAHSHAKSVGGFEDRAPRFHSGGNDRGFPRADARSGRPSSFAVRW